MWVSTFHAACSRILRREATLLGYRSSFTIYDQADAQRLTDWVRRDLNLDPKRFPARQLHAQISALKNELVLPAEYAEMAVGPAERRLAEVYTEYQRRLQEASAVDFDDLLVLAVRLFREHPEALERYRSASSTSSSTSSRTPTPRSGSSCACSPQEHRSVMVVGDVDQSDLQVPRGRLPELVEVRGRVPGSDDGRARPELPVDAAHPRRGERGDREQRVARGRSTLDRQGRGRADRPLPG